LNTAPKSPEEPLDCRIIQDLSFPRNNPLLASVNDQININNFRCDWGTFNNVRNIVIDAPVDVEAATMDVDVAFRCCPISPSQQQNFIIHWNNLFYIDHNTPFGTVSSGGVFGRVANAMTAILVAKGFSPVKNWVNNFVLFRFPLSPGDDPPNFSYSLIDIYNLASCLGWPWKPLKTKPFASEFKYSGFTWNLAKKTVQIPLLKKVCYTTKLEP
jgi:hypothetical protein